MQATLNKMDQHKMNFRDCLLTILSLRTNYRYKNCTNYFWKETWTNRIDYDQNTSFSRRKQNPFFPLPRSLQWQIENHRRNDSQWSGWKYPGTQQKEQPKHVYKIWKTTEHSCTCPDRRYRKHTCKHMKAIQESIVARQIGVQLGEIGLVSQFI